MIGQDGAILSEIENPTIPELKENVTHIACVGDSITFGYWVWACEMSKEHTYPSWLEKMMGDGYQTLNYGVCAKTLLKEGDDPYTSHYMYDESVKADAEIYIIMIGTNDSKPYNWNTGDFKSELKDFVQTYISLGDDRKVCLATPPRAFGDGEEVFCVSNDVIENEIAPIVREVAEETGAVLIDMYEETKDHPEWFLDGVHPSSEGNKEFAKIITSFLSEER
jgi:lysophospholipase L1-like esterase